MYTAVKLTPGDQPSPTIELMKPLSANIAEAKLPHDRRVLIFRGIEVCMKERRAEIWGELKLIAGQHGDFWSVESSEPKGFYQTSAVGADAFLSELEENEALPLQKAGIGFISLISRDQMSELAEEIGRILEEEENVTALSILTHERVLEILDVEIK